ncbi:MAG: hypothetical protein AAB438_03660 [Patescibacteria group bacterium]
MKKSLFFAAFSLFASFASAQSFQDFVKLFPQEKLPFVPKVKVVSKEGFLPWDCYKFIPNAEAIAIAESRPVSFAPICSFKSKKCNVLIVQVEVGLKSKYLQMYVFEGNKFLRTRKLANNEVLMSKNILMN